MRIISQDGMIDVPYERFIISVSMQNQGEVIAWTGNSISDDECIVMAVYSSLVKVQKAMEMLREAYAGLPIVMQNIKISEDVAKIFERFKKQGICIQTADNEPSKVEYINNGYFQFPSDDEVEV